MRQKWTVVIGLVSVFAVSARAGVYTGGAVAADHPLASEAGAEMLRAGGNAVDAAVAAGFVLSVVEPYACGIGGGGFLLLTMPDDPRTDEVGDALRLAIDFRETAPAAVTADYFVNMPAEAAQAGGRSIGVPGMVAGLLETHERFGVLERSAVLAPAIRLAEEGFEVSADYEKTAAGMRRWFRSDLSRQTTFSYVWNHLIAQAELKAGVTLTNAEQAKALRLLSERGAEAFYKGEIAEALVASVAGAGGEMTAADLAAYRPIDREPVVGSFLGRTVLVMPPPSSGGIAAVQILGLLERYSENNDVALADFEHNSVSWMHALAEAFKHAFADRNAYMGDADFAEVPWERLITKEHLDALAARTFPARTRRPNEYGTPGMEAEPLPDDAGTSHLSILDAAGNAVACTLTNNTEFGSKVVVDGFGFVLNNELDDFTTRPGRPNVYNLKQSAANAPAPGKRPLSSMSPTIVLSPEGDVEVIAGASGGPRIITATVQAIVNALVFDMSAEDAVTSPRVHDQLWPPALYLEPEWDLGGQIDTDDVLELQRWMKTSKRNEVMRFDLTGIGHSLRRMEIIGAVQLVKRTDAGVEAASDPRKGGVPAGIE